MFFLAEFEETSGVFVAHGDGNFFSQFQCGGARTVAVGEDMEVGDGKRVDESQDLLEFLLGLTVEACHNVGGDACVWHYGFDFLQLGGVEGGVVTSVHELEYMVGAGLQGDVEVGKESTAVGDEVDDVVGEEVGLDAGDAVAQDAFDLVEFFEQVEEGFVLMLTEGAGVDASEYHLFGTIVGDTVGGAKGLLNSSGA